MPQARILVLAGSGDPQSPASHLAAAFLRELALQDADVTYVSLADYPLPICDEARPDGAALRPVPLPDVPIAARKLAALFQANHAIVVSAAELNGTLAPLIANALHWIAAVPRQAGATPRPLFALGVAARGDSMAESALSHLRDLVVAAFGATLVDSLAIGDGAAAFDENGQLRRPADAAALNRLARDLVFMARRLAVEP